MEPNRGKGLEASGRGGTIPTPSVCRSFHLRTSCCDSCGFPSSRIRKYNWSEKAIGRKTTGTGRMRSLRHVAVRFKFNFREGTEAAPRKKRGSASY